MTRLVLHSFIAVVTVITSITPVYGSSITSSATSSTASTPTSLPLGVEVDIIFPIQNATYNITKSLPIVIAVQNLTAAAALGPFTFGWDIMPFGNVGETPIPGGVTNDLWFSPTFTVANTSTEPYIIINQTDVQKWYFKPRGPPGSIYALQWGIQWNHTAKVCDPDYYGSTGYILFNINLGSPEPDLGSLTGKCPQQGSVFEIDTTPTNSSCSAVVKNGSKGNPCAITVDEARVESISSAVQSVITASAVAASASSASEASATMIHTPTPHSIAAGSDIPLAAVFLLGSLQVWHFPNYLQDFRVDVNPD